MRKNVNKRGSYSLPTIVNTFLVSRLSLFDPNCYYGKRHHFSNEVNLGGYGRSGKAKLT